MFFERHEGGENAILVHLDMTDDKEREDPHEFRELARSAGISEIDFVTVSSNKPSPRYFIGQGKVEEIQQLVTLHKADVVLFNHALSPVRNVTLKKNLSARSLTARA